MLNRPPDSPPDLSALEAAMWRTVAYVDEFDYPLTAGEVHRYLDRMTAPWSAVKTALAQTRQLDNHNDFYTLPGRKHIIETRLERAAYARRLWPHAVRYGRIIARLPFVRMVAVTGSLAVNNVTPDADIDFLIITSPGRLWVCRAMILAVGRLAAQNQVLLCPNFLLSQTNLLFTDQNIYTAHELSQMIPLAGLSVYQTIRQTNRWTHRYLPNAAGPPPGQYLATSQAELPTRLQIWAEMPLRTAVGSWLEQWEMRRKIRKLQTAVTPQSDTCFTANQCKGHFNPHQQRTIHAYQKKTSEQQQCQERS